MKPKLKKLAATLTGSLFLFPISLLAETDMGGKTSLNLNPLGVIESIPKLLNNVIGYMLATALIVAPIVIIWGAFQMLLSAGDPTKFKDGQKTIVYVVIGLIIILLAKGMTAIIEKVFTG